MSAEPLAAVSDTLFTVSVVVYTLALLGFCVEMAVRRRTDRQPAVDREVVGAGPRPPAASAGEPAPSARTGTGADSRGEVPGRLAVALTALAAGAHAGVLFTRGLATERPPWGNVYEFATAVVLVAVVAFLALLRRAPEARRLGVFVVGPALVALVLVGLFLYTAAGPLVAALRSAWLAVHVSAAVLGFGTFLVSGIANSLYLIRRRADSRRGVERSGSGWTDCLPTADTLDAVGYRTAVFGFPIWTFAVIAGAIWAESAWGRFWGWDPKETWAFVAWVIYAAYLHARSTAGWRGRPAACINVVGLAAMVFNLLYVNYVSTGLHSYAGS